MMAMMMVISVTVALAGGVATTKENQSEKVPVIIMFKDKTDKELIKQHGGELKCVYHLKPAVAASLPQKAIDALKKNQKIDYIVPDLEVFTMAETLDWGVDRIDADIVHEYNILGTWVKVAIMDTGIDYDHPDLAANYKGGYDFGGEYSGASNDDDPMDFKGHGTHCAGIVAAVKGNDIGVIGVAPEAYLYAVKVFSDDDLGNYSDVIEGLEWCITNDMQVISMSFGSAYTAGDPGIEPWINDVYDAGILLVGAAGNDGNGRGSGDNVIYPARYSNVIAVAATGSNDKRARWSSTGPDVELAAPGVSIYSTYMGGGYATKSGTSMACPHVAGTAALLIAAGEGDVRLRLQETADDLGAAGKDNQYGYGLVDADEAALPTGNQAPVANAGADQTAFVGETVSFNGSGSYDPDGTIVTYDWVFGDGETGAGVTTTHAYATAGTYTVTLTVTDNEGATGTDTASVTVTAPNEPPVADANGPYTGIEGDEILFNGLGSSDPDSDTLTYAWDFGDGSTGIGVSPTYTYNANGTYTVALTVNDSKVDSDPSPTTATISDVDPVASFTSDSPKPEGEVMSFTDTSTSYDGITLWSWVFGDGGISSVQNPTHPYESVGTYVVDLTVTEADGDVDTTTAQVKVIETPTNAMHVASIDMSTDSTSRGRNTFVWGVAAVTIVNNSGIPVDGATVSGQWSNATSDSDSGVTDGNGQISLKSDSVKNPQTGTKFTFTVDTVTKDGWSYNPSANVIIKNSTTAG